MKKIKFNLSNIEGKLSRVEMQQILGGCGGSRSDCDSSIPKERCACSRRGYRNGDPSNYVCCFKFAVRLTC